MANEAMRYFAEVYRIASPERLTPTSTGSHAGCGPCRGGSSSTTG